MSCEIPEPESVVVRAAPDSLILTPGERRETLVRGCVFDDSFDDLTLAYLIQVRAVAESRSEGVVELDLPDTPPGQLSPDGSSNVERVPVTRGTAVSLDQAYEFFDLPVRVAGPTRRDQCSEWLPVVFAWNEVMGNDALEIVWEVAFAVNDSHELGIDFGDNEQ